MKLSNELKAYFIIVSTIIGLGIFYLPYTFWQSGYYFLFWIIFLFFIFLILHLMLGEILMQTQEKYNLPGLASIYLHPLMKNFVWFFDYFGMLGVFLIYFNSLVEFWHIILPNLNQLFLKILFALFNIFFIFKDIRIFSKMEAVLTIGIFLIAFSIIFLLLPNFNFSYLNTAIRNNFQPFLPYSVLLFALSGTSALPIVCDLIGKNKKSFFKINFFGILTIVLIYIIYSVVAIGVLGEKVSEESLKSLAPYFPQIFLIFAIIFVTLNITFVDMAFYLKRGLINDYKFSPEFANWILFISIIPLTLIGHNSLIAIIDLTSSIFLGFNLFIIGLIYLKLKKKEYFKIPNFVVLILISVFIFGIIWFILDKTIKV
jgi:hypothetical protein